MIPFHLLTILIILSGPIDGEISLVPLQKFFIDFLNSDIVIQIKSEKGESEDLDHFFVGDLLKQKISTHQEFFQSKIWILDVFQSNEEKQRIARSHTYKRLINMLSLQHRLPIDSNDICNQIYMLVQKPDLSLQHFMNGFCYIYEKFLTKIDIMTLISLMKVFQKDEVMKSRLFAFFNLINGLEDKYPDIA